MGLLWEGNTYVVDMLPPDELFFLILEHYVGNQQKPLADSALLEAGDILFGCTSTPLAIAYFLEQNDPHSPITECYHLTLSHR